MQQLSVSLSLQQGNEYLDQNRYEAALEVFQQARETEYSNPQILCSIGLSFYFLGDYKSSIHYFDEALKIEADSILSLAWRGMAYQKLKFFQQAEIDFLRVTTIQSQTHEHFKGRGIALMELGRYDEAIDSYTEASKLFPSDHHIWCNRASALGRSRKYQEALDSLDEAIKIKPNYLYAWRERGVLLRNLKRSEEALTSYNRALEIQPNDYKTWLYRGHVLQKLDRYSEALESYGKALNLNPTDKIIKAGYNKAYEKLIKEQKGIEISPTITSASFKQRGDDLKLKLEYAEALVHYNKALDIEPKDYSTWSRRGDVLVLLNRYREAISSYEKALSLNPEDKETWYKQGKAFSHSNLPERAAFCYRQALELDHDYAQAWNGLGNALKSLRNYKTAFNAYKTAIDCSTRIKKLYYYCWRPLNNLGWLIFDWQGYKQAILSWDNALRNYLQLDKVIQKQGCGAIHYSKGKAHYIYGKQQGNPLSYWREAKKSYELALNFLTFQESPERYLEILQDLIKVCRHLGQNKVASELLHTGSDCLERLLQETILNNKKIQLAQRFAGFTQLRVDELAESSNTQEKIQALQLAENRKNSCLAWLRDGWADRISHSIEYEDIQQLLDNDTIIVYWHISPAAITTFILKHNDTPIILPVKAKSASFAYPVNIRQLQEFEDWMNTWKKDYHKYREQPLGRCDINSSNNEFLWFEQMPTRISQLSEILNLQGIIPYISNIKKIILVPHRDLHLVPIHACFPEDITVVYLPSIQIGLNLQRFTTNENNSILSVDNPRNDLSFAIIESTIISLVYQTNEDLNNQLATKDNVIRALNKQTNCFHFAGHGYHDSKFPKKSALKLANRELLTLEDLFRLDFRRCHLVCLSACETGITSKQNLLDEYVGLVSGFLAVGASCVISTLWAVHSEASALLMIDFHQRRQMGKPEPIALAEAVRWLKTVTVGELSIWYEEILSRLPDNELKIRPFLETELDKLSLGKQDDKLYEHPYYWAAFTITGRNY